MRHAFYLSTGCRRAVLYPLSFNTLLVIYISLPDFILKISWLPSLVMWHSKDNILSKNRPLGSKLQRFLPKMAKKHGFARLKGRTCIVLYLEKVVNGASIFMLWIPSVRQHERKNIALEELSILKGIFGKPTEEQSKKDSIETPAKHRKRLRASKTIEKNEKIEWIAPNGEK